MSRKTTCLNSNLAGTACLAAALLSNSVPANAEVLQGSVVSGSGTPIAGAIVTLTDRRGVSESVYSSQKGTFKLDAALTGPIELNVRKRFHADFNAKLMSAATNKPLVVRLRALTDQRLISEDHPSLSHFSRIAFDKDEKAPLSRPNFTRDCLTCHSVGNVSTRHARPAEAWLPTLQRMHRYAGRPDFVWAKERSELLAKAFDGSLATSRPEIPIDSLLEQAKIYRWRLEGAALPHDVDIHSTNGKAYATDMFAGAVIEVDLQSGERKRYLEPADGMPPGGWFAKHGVPTPYGLTVSHAPHSLAEGKDGKYYLTDSIGGTIAEFDPLTKQFKHYEIGGISVYPHTIRAAADGTLWFTIIASNQVGHFDPENKKIQVVDLPGTPVLSTFAAGPGPYGIDINPKDGGVWYAKLFSDKIGRIDPVTLEVKEFDSPVRGPRRQRFDASGALWVAGFAEGAIARIDVATWESKVYRLPEYAKGEIPAPYALGVHPQTQEIWINDTMLDLVWRFLPNEERFIAYPLPLKGTYTRDFVFTQSGWACTSNNPIPATALEGGSPELICIDAQVQRP